MTTHPPTDTPRLAVAPDARALGLRHVRGWTLSAAGPLTEPVLGAEEAAGLLARLPREDSVTGYRKLMAALGHPGTTPAGERLRELVAGREWSGHGGVIDAVTLASVALGGGIGLHDLTGVPDGSSLLVRRSPGGERIVPAFSSRSRPVPAGDLTYGLRSPGGEFAPMAWLGKRDTDSAEHQVSAASRRVCVLALGHPDDTPEHTASAIGAVGEVLGVLGIAAEVQEIPETTEIPE
ncbi:hypothetical protein [Streptomyces sp. NPDC003717]|uniref:hypothetical protein n=1 Tax=Streptomyces sp. NPDC003717 TaxID=3154276 RepID=UPI0033BA6B4C